MKFSQPTRASCSCGAVKIRVRGALARLYCHCKICQRLNEAPYGDPVFLWRWHAKVDDPKELVWSRHRWTPINLNRGSCRSCGMLILEHLAASPLSVVVGKTWEEPVLMPPARGHIFYESRTEDIDDGLPKRSGYVSSELAVTKWVLASMFRRS